MCVSVCLFIYIGWVLKVYGSTVVSSLPTSIAFFYSNNPGANKHTLKQHSLRFIAGKMGTVIYNMQPANRQAAIEEFVKSSHSDRFSLQIPWRFNKRLNCAVAFNIMQIICIHANSLACPQIQKKKRKHTRRTNKRTCPFHLIRDPQYILVYTLWQNV